MEQSTTLTAAWHWVSLTNFHLNWSSLKMQITDQQSLGLDLYICNIFLCGFLGHACLQSEQDTGEWEADLRVARASNQKRLRTLAVTACCGGERERDWRCCREISPCLRIKIAQQRVECRTRLQFVWCRIWNENRCCTPAQYGTSGHPSLWVYGPMLYCWATVSD